jgi:hypothetical protein
MFFRIKKYDTALKKVVFLINKRVAVVGNMPAAKHSRDSEKYG